MKQLTILRAFQLLKHFETKQSQKNENDEIFQNYFQSAIGNTAASHESEWTSVSCDMSVKYNHLKLTLLNSETKHDVILSQVKANEELLKRLEQKSLEQMCTINELLFEMADPEMKHLKISKNKSVTENLFASIITFIEFVWRKFSFKQNILK